MDRDSTSQTGRAVEGERWDSCKRMGSRHCHQLGQHRSLKLASTRPIVSTGVNAADSNSDPWQPSKAGRSKLTADAFAMWRGRVGRPNDATAAAQRGAACA